MDIASAIERSAQLRSKVSAMEAAVVRQPDDKGLRITLLSTKRRAERAEKELMETASTSQVDLCRYRVVRASSDEYAALHVSQSLISYQNLFTALYAYLRSGVVKASASYQKGIKQQSLLNIAYTYPGSMGVLLTVNSQQNLFGEGELDRLAGYLNEVTSITDASDVKRLAREFGLNVVRKTYDWAAVNANADYSLDVQWHRASGTVGGSFVSRDQFGKIANLIGQVSDVVPTELDVIGTLGAYSILSDTFAITTAEGDIYKGKLHEDFLKREYKIPAVYRAKIRMRTLVKYASETEEVSYQLLSLLDL